jgi:hypothetical protein
VPIGRARTEAQDSESPTQHTKKSYKPCSKGVFPEPSTIQNRIELFMNSLNLRKFSQSLVVLAGMLLFCQSSRAAEDFKVIKNEMIDSETSFQWDYWFQVSPQRALQVYPRYGDPTIEWGFEFTPPGLFMNIDQLTIKVVGQHLIGPHHGVDVDPGQYFELHADLGGLEEGNFKQLDQQLKTHPARDSHIVHLDLVTLFGRLGRVPDVDGTVFMIQVQGFHHPVPEVSSVLGLIAFSLMCMILVKNRRVSQM